MKLGIILVISLLIVGSFGIDVAEGCKNLSISTQMRDNGEFAYDVMDKGNLNP